ncbi:hypothetical protein E1287_14300 [Actinomadura sp. KC06]|uniref:hypothetical protein n=1 Tax=Actinomadura sp. KC06 TaxID=2530369 RepID=UPI00104CCCE3|nr:hypothetical protein [Actinomadura sp. KC06]TDD35274.1 hypothetical protein E1287_14300 [Actinomadura sp. KC06]
MVVDDGDLRRQREVAMIDIPALLGVFVGFALSVTGLLGAQAQPVHGGRDGSGTSDERPDTRAWGAAQAVAGPWLLAAGIADLLAGAVLFGMPPDGPWIPVLIMAFVLTVLLLAVAALMSVREVTAWQDDL